MLNKKIQKQKKKVGKLYITTHNIPVVGLLAM
jgi:hypothetical protein